MTQSTKRVIQKSLSMQFLEEFSGTFPQQDFCPTIPILLKPRHFPDICKIPPNNSRFSRQAITLSVAIRQHLVIKNQCILHVEAFHQLLVVDVTANVTLQQMIGQSLI